MVKFRFSEEFIFDSIVYLLLFLVFVLCVFPLLYVVSSSITPFEETIRSGGFVLFPTKVTLQGYRQIMRESTLPNGFWVTIRLTLVGTTLNLILTALLAYPLSFATLPGRKYFLLYIIFTMLFSAGLIPTYLVIKSLGIINTFWVMIFPMAISPFLVLIMKTFFEKLPQELFESARMDGAQEVKILWHIALPLSLPVLATVGLFYGVSHWNQFMLGVIYISDRSLHPLQLVLRSIILEASIEEVAELEETVPSMTLKMAAVVFTATPIIAVYPFLQRYFVKGLTIGAVKG